MTVQYFAKVVDHKTVDVAVARDAKQVETLRQRQYEPCSRAFYDAALRTRRNQFITHN